MSATLSPRAEAAARVRAEGLINLLEAAEIFPRDRWKAVSTKSVLRWIVAGKRGVRLDAVRVRGRWFTSVAAIERFVRGMG